MPKTARRPAWFGLVLALALVACSDPTGADVPVLTGTWSGSTEPGDVPATMQLTLLEQDGVVTGAGVIFIAQTIHSLSITGVHVYPDVSLTNRGDAFNDFNYTGRFQGGSAIVGNLRGSGFTGELVILTRQD